MHHPLESVIVLSDQLRGLYYLWLNAHERGLPPRLDLLKLQNAAAGMDSLVVTEILRDADGRARDFQFIYIGRRVSAATRHDLTGTLISEDPEKSRGSLIWAAYSAIAEDPRPRVVQLPYIGSSPGHCCTQELFLPVSDGTFPTRYVLVGIEFQRPDRPGHAPDHCVSFDRDGHGLHR